MAARQADTEATLAAITSKSEFKRERVREAIRAEGDENFESKLGGKKGEVKKNTWLSDDVGDAMIVKDDE